ncbi:MAG TPA: sporulation protein YunB [Clostridiales bacterium]|nr:sporulation protein YunB [Clostridiales bacterium]
MIRRKRFIKSRFIFYITVIIAILIIMLIIIDTRIKPVLFAICEAKVRVIATESINEAVGKRLLGNVSYEDFVTMVRDSSGKINALQANTVKMNLIASQLTEYVIEELNKRTQQGIEIPVGATLQSSIFAGAGPMIRVKVLPVGSVEADFVSQFEQAGVNQTRHSINIRVETQVRVAVPLDSYLVTVVSHVPVVDTVIIGDVPRYYVNVDDGEQILDIVPRPSGE